MKEKIYDARTGMEYALVDDYYLPALKLPRTRPIGRWGMLHKAYLKLRKPAYYQSLLLSGKLDTVLANVEEQAVERYEVLIEQLSQREGVSEKLKEENQVEWVRRMSNLENRAAEIVKTELIENQTLYYTKKIAETENWNLQDIYSDEGKSGTSLRKRDAFKRMMRDAKDQKMDLIICASISRFARNFSDCMTQIAALKTMHPAHPIGVYFETENIYTLNPSSQYSLDMLSVFLEVRPISAFCRGKIGSLLQLRHVLPNIQCPLRSRTGC